MDITALSGLVAPSRAADDQATLGDQFDGFLTLLTTQLQNQDPLSPLDSNEFTAQLVQFTSVEQSIRTNEQLEQLISLTQQSESARALDYLGLTVEATSDFVRLDDDGDVVITVDLPDAVATASLEITDPQGGVVRRIPLAADSGRQTITWDGTSGIGLRAGTGLYQVAVRALGTDDAPLAVAPHLQGVVDAVEFEDGILNLAIGGVTVPHANISRVVNPPTAAQS